MTIQDEGRHLADQLDEGVEQGGMFLSPSDCELAARALRWLAMVGDLLSERIEDDVPLARSESSSPLRLLS